MKQSIHVKTARVTGHAQDQSAIIERVVVKLEEGKSFDNFVKHLKLKGFLASEPPVVVKAIELDKNGKWVEIDKKPFQAQIAEKLKVEPVKGKVDYKAQYEAVMARLDAMEGKKEDDTDIMGDDDTNPVREEADALGITYPKNIGDKALEKKIADFNADLE